MFIYMSDLIVTLVQQGDMNIIGRIVTLGHILSLLVLQESKYFSLISLVFQKETKEKT